jgi:hypothetical protein
MFRVVDGVILDSFTLFRLTGIVMFRLYSKEG